MRLPGSIQGDLLSGMEAEYFGAPVILKAATILSGDVLAESKVTVAVDALKSIEHFRTPSHFLNAVTTAGGQLTGHVIPLIFKVTSTALTAGATGSVAASAALRRLEKNTLHASVSAKQTFSISCSSQGEAMNIRQSGWD